MPESSHGWLNFDTALDLPGNREILRRYAASLIEMEAARKAAEEIAFSTRIHFAHGVKESKALATQILADRYTAALKKSQPPAGA